MYPSRVLGDQANNFPSYPAQFDAGRDHGFVPGDYETSQGHSPGRIHGGPRYADLPNSSEDMRKLEDECASAREGARVLSEALVFTQPSELNSKPIIQVSP